MTALWITPSPLVRGFVTTAIVIATCGAASYANTEAEAFVVNNTTTILSNLPEGFHSDVDEITLSAGHFHTCAVEYRTGIEFGGPLRCWGYDSQGQASPPPGIFVQVSCGHTFSCAVRIDQTVSCWGDESIDTAPPGLFTQVSCGENHACGVLARDGSIACWGRNDFGQADPPNTGKFVQVTSGNGSTCGIRTNGTVLCWGKNDHGQSNPLDSIQFKQISASILHHVCGVTLGGDITCWGNNSRGQSEQQQGPFLQVSSGPRSTCGIREDRSIVCWGRPSRIPAESMNTIEYDQITLGKDHVCAVDMESELHCWHAGANLGGQDVPLGFVVG